MPTIAAITPIVLLIAAGVAFGRLRGVDRAGVAVLNAFTTWLALPALLFRALAGSGGGGMAPSGFLLAFGGGMALSFVTALIAIPLPAGARRLSDRSLAALVASYANTAFIGIPLAGGLLGEAGRTAAVAASLLTVAALFAVAALLVEIDRARIAGNGLVTAAGRVATALARNPLVAAPLAGVLWRLTALPLPSLADRTLTLLADAASPCALIAIGAFLALPRRAAGPRPLAAVLAIKLVLQPAATAILALWVLPAVGSTMPPGWAVAAILLAALPTGTGPFMLAELYRREAGLAGRAILVSTIAGLASVATLAALLIR